MSAEIELKLLVNASDKAQLIDYFNQLPQVDLQVTKQLTNGYFDTPNLQLRQWDMGLRIRGVETWREQTIKTAGEVIGGLHSRPEYNVELQENNPTTTPILNLFPEQIWPENTDLDQLQSQLCCLFHTDFTRHQWHIYVGQSMVEVAFDEGLIHAGEQANELTTPICEVEFELLAGDVSALFELAQALAAIIPVRLGKASKAQRGYQLAAQVKNNSQLALDRSLLLPTPYIPLQPSQTMTESLETIIATGLSRWLELEQALELSTQDPLATVVLWLKWQRTLRIQKLALQQFGLLNETNHGLYHALMEALDFLPQAKAYAHLIEARVMGKHKQAKQFEQFAQEKLIDIDFAARLAQMQQTPAYGQMQLCLLQLLLQLQKEQRQISKDNVQAFADKQQDISWQLMFEIMPPAQDLNASEYIDTLKKLQDSLLVGVMFGALYSEECGQERDQFRAPWRDLMQGIATLESYQIALHLAEEFLPEQLADLQDWVIGKEESLLCALNFSRQSAQTVTPYWR